MIRVVRRLCLLMFVPLFCGPAQMSCLQADDMRLRVMTFNIWHGGEAGGQPLAKTADVIRRARADIVGIQESHGPEVDGVRPDNAEKLAELLNWNCQPQPGHTAVLSRFPVVTVTPEQLGVEIEYGPEQTLHFFNVHFAASPYQPYQLLKIPYGEYPFIDTPAEAVAWANRARGDQVVAVLGELRAVLRKDVVVVVTGDFNEPSHLDWTVRSRDAGLCPLAVSYPATRRIAAIGLRDTFRVVHPDERRQPGFTWTPLTAVDDPQDHHDRIDYVFASGGRVRVTDCQVVGESEMTSEIVVTPWPSDHRAVVTTLMVSPRQQGSP